MKTTIITAMTVILLLAGTAVAQPGGMSGRPMNNPDMHAERHGSPEGDFLQRMLPVMRILDFTDTQREAVQNIMQEARESMEITREEPGTHREEFIHLFSSPNITTAQIEALLDERTEKMEETHVIIARALVDIHDILTAEQLAALAEFDPASHEMRMGNRGNMDHPGARREEHTRR